MVTPLAPATAAAIVAELVELDADAHIRLALGLQALACADAAHGASARERGVAERWLRQLERRTATIVPPGVAASLALSVSAQLLEAEDLRALAGALASAGPEELAYLDALAASDADQRTAHEQLGLGLEIDGSASSRWTGLWSDYEAVCRRLEAHDPGLALRHRLRHQGPRLRPHEPLWQQRARLTYDRLQRLQAMTAALARSLSPEQLGRVVLREGLQLLEASGANLSRLRPDGSLEIFAMTGGTGGELAAYRVMGPDERSPNTDAVRTRSAVYLRSRAAIASMYPHLLGLAEAVGEHAWAAIPLVFEGRVLGNMGIGFAVPRGFPDDEQDFLRAVAQQCAMSLARSEMQVGSLLRQLSRDELQGLQRQIDALLADDR